MVASERALTSRVGLVEAVDHLLNRGAVVVGRSTISLAGVDLVCLELKLVLSSVETLRRGLQGPMLPPLQVLPAPETGELREESPRVAGHGGSQSPTSSSHDVGAIHGLPLHHGDQDEQATVGEPQASADAGGRPDRGLAQLVLTLVELLRQVVERQAVRRMAGGALSTEEEERMGMALLELEAKMAELRNLFDLKEEDVNLDLGPLGRLL